MKTPIFITLLLFVCSSCSVQKHRQEKQHGQILVRAGGTSLRDSLLNRWEEVHFRNGLLLQREWAAVVPDGRFSLSADSGFSGRAVRILFYRERLQQESQWDSTAGAEQHLTSRQEDSLVIRSQQSRNLRTETDIRTRDFYWLLLPGIVAGLLWFLRRIRR